MMKKININTLTQCLKQLHQFEEILCTTSSIEDSSQHNALKEEHLSLLKSTMELVQCLRTEHWNKIPTSVKEQMPSVEPPSNTDSVEIIYLLGRCFNLSLNSKILEQCQYSDPTMAEKLLKDFHILETVLNNKLNESPEDLSATMTRLII